MALHRPALAYDWRERFGLSLSAIHHTVTWSEAWELTKELLLDPFSHVVASVNGWARAPHPTEVLGANLIDVIIAVQPRKKHAMPPRPIERPWLAPRADAIPHRSSEDRIAGRKKLAERLGLST